MEIDHRRSIQNVCRNHLSIYDTGMYFLSKQRDDKLILDKYQIPVTPTRQVINNLSIRPSLRQGGGGTLTRFKRGSGEGRPSFSNCFVSPFPQYPSQPLWRILEGAWVGGVGEEVFGGSKVKAVFISKGFIHSLPVLVAHIPFSYQKKKANCSFLFSPFGVSSHDIAKKLQVPITSVG